MATAPCTPLPADVKLGNYARFSSGMPKCPDNHIGKPLFFGRSNKDEPMYVAMDFEQYRIAKNGMTIATGVAVVLGIAFVVALIKKKKSKFVAPRGLSI